MKFKQSYTKKKDQIENMLNFVNSCLFNSIDNMSFTAWTEPISNVDIVYSVGEKGKYKITFKTGENILVTPKELDSQRKMAKKIFDKFGMIPPKLILSEYEKFGLFIIQKARGDKITGELDNLTKPQRPSKYHKRSKYDNRGELTPSYNRKEVKICFLSRCVVSGGMR